MKELIDVFRMEEISPSVRIEIIKKLGVAINHQYGMNITDDLVADLVKLLTPPKPDECELTNEQIEFLDDVNAALPLGSTSAWPNETVGRLLDIVEKLRGKR